MAHQSDQPSPTDRERADAERAALAAESALPRRRRAGEDDAAIQRALDATRRYGVVRSSVNAAPPGPTILDDYQTVFGALADVVLDGFCDWCVVDVVRPERRRLLVHGPSAHAESALRARVPDLEALVDLAVRDGRRQRYPVDVTTGLPWCVVLPLTVHDDVVATVGFVRDDRTPGFGPMEATAADEMVWGAASTIERLDLRRRADRATAAANRVAEHLRSLIAASI